MPTSYPENISRIITLIMEIGPHSILDAGTGFGKYGFLCREYLDVCRGRFQKKDWQIKIDGIEGFEPYLSDLQRLIYDKILSGDIFEIFSKAEKQSYDLLLAIDILEHFEKRQGARFLQECIRIGRLVLVSVPIGYAQGAVFGNLLEQHRAEWSKKDFQALRAPLILKGHQSWIVLLSQNFPENLLYLKRIKSLEFARKIKWKLKKRLSFLSGPSST